MDGPRRVELLPPDPPKSIITSSTKQPSSNSTVTVSVSQTQSATVSVSVNSKSSNKAAVRFEIKLEESTDEKCPEISYADLLLKHEMRKKRPNSSASKSDLNASFTNNAFPNDDPFGDNDTENLEALARRMEEKYGKSYVTSARNRYVDLGDGYDTDDSFIDNEEAYDELVPSTLTTQHGGFYINCGLLDFKEISDDEIVNEGEARKKLKKKRRIILSDSEDGSLNKSSQPIKKKKIKSLSTGKEKKSILAKKKLLKHDSSEREKLIKKKKLLQKKKLVEKAKLTLSDSELNQKSKQYDSVIDDVLMKGALLSPNPSHLGNINKVKKSNSNNTTETQDSSVAKKDKDNKEPAKLPDNLPQPCIDMTRQLQKLAENCTTEKGKFFTSDVNKILIGLDNEVRLISSANTRNGVYSFLSSFLPINRETLMKRIKLLRQKELNDKLEEPLEKLKTAIKDSMPSQIEKYTNELQQRQVCQQEDSDKAKEDTQDSDEETNPNHLSMPSTGNESPSQTSAAEKRKDGSKSTLRKKYEWTDQVRSCLCDVVTLKMQSYELMKSKGQSAEDYLKEFLENEVRVLWPKGWMQTRVLFRESRLAHIKWTNPSQVPTKVNITNKKPPLITNAIKMAANMSNTVKKSANPAVSVTVSGKASTTDTQRTNSQDSKFKAISLSSGTLQNSVAKPVTVKTIKSPTITLTDISTSKNQELPVKNLPADGSKPNSSTATTVTTTSSGEKIVLDGNKVIGKLVQTPPSTVRKVAVSSTAASATPVKDSSTAPSNQLSKEIPQLGLSQNGSSRASVVDIATASTTSNATTSADESKSKLMIDPTALTIANTKKLLVSHQKMAAQNKQAAASAVLHTAQALQQQHLAASIANQKAMLQHKKMAEDLINKQQLAKQQQIAAIVNEQKIAANMAAQQRLAHQKQIAMQQQLVEQQKLAARQHQQQQHQQQHQQQQQQHQQLGHYSNLPLNLNSSSSQGSLTYHTRPQAGPRVMSGATQSTPPKEHRVYSSSRKNRSSPINSSGNSVSAAPVSITGSSPSGVSVSHIDLQGRANSTLARSSVHQPLHVLPSGFPLNYPGTSVTNSSQVSSHLVIPNWPGTTMQQANSLSAVQMAAAAEYRRTMDARGRMDGTKK